MDSTIFISFVKCATMFLSSDSFIRKIYNAILKTQYMWFQNLLINNVLVYSNEGGKDIFCFDNTHK